MTPSFVAAKDVATALGISTRMVHQLLDAGELPWVNIGRRRRIPIREFEAWIEARTADALATQRNRRMTVLDARVNRSA